jgi:nucleosome binding factor SPN SPT16 subunit
MPEAFIRPALDGKRLPGEVEIHQNGIRYQSMGSQKVGMSSPIFSHSVI